MLFAKLVKLRHSAKRFASFLDSCRKGGDKKLLVISDPDIGGGVGQQQAAANNPALLRNKAGLLENKRGLLENKAGLLPDRGRFAAMQPLISKSNNKKIKKGIYAKYPFLITL